MMWNKKGRVLLAVESNVREGGAGALLAKGRTATKELKIPVQLKLVPYIKAHRIDTPLKAGHTFKSLLAVLL